MGRSGESFFGDIRVLKPGGTFSVSDLRRDLSPEIYQFMLGSCQGPEIKKGFQTSVQAAYTKEELENLLQDISFTQVRLLLTRMDWLLLVRNNPH
jgi:hypothetical protein